MHALCFQTHMFGTSNYANCRVQDITSFVLTDLKAGETQGFYKAKQTKQTRRSKYLGVTWLHCSFCAKQVCPLQPCRPLSFVQERLLTLFAACALGHPDEPRGHHRPKPLVPAQGASDLIWKRWSTWQQPWVTIPSSNPCGAWRKHAVFLFEELRLCPCPHFVLSDCFLLGHQISK